MREFHLEERPTSFKQVVGQEMAVQQLIALGKSEAGIPHCLLFSGPSGCGKTTLARIVRNKLRCSDSDFCEVNAADNRGIDMVREIQGRVGLAPIRGDSRVWLVDEAQALTPDAQGAFLKLLEEPPNHVYFMLATTNPEKLKVTIRTRCTEIKVRALTEGEIVGLVNRIVEDHNAQPLSKDVVEKLAEVAEGSARKALVLLGQIIGIEDEKQQIQILQSADAKRAAFEIAQALMARKPWSFIAEIIRSIEDEPEGVRYLILAYFTKVALGGGKQADFAVQIMENFQYDYFSTKRAGLVLSCYRACGGK